MTNKISLGALFVRPYDRSSAVANNKPGFDLFDNRNHFLLFRNTCGVAVCLWLVNNLSFRINPAGVRVERLVIALEKCGKGGQRLAEHCIRDFRMSRSEATRPMRIDLAVESERLTGYDTYRIVVEADGHVVGSRQIRLFPIFNIRVLPTKWYYPRLGWTSVGNQRFMSPGSMARDTLKVHFRLEPLLSGTPVLPELEISITDPSGRTISSVCHPRRQSDGTVAVAAGFAIESLRRGVCCARIHCMTYAFGGFLFSTDGTAVAGQWDKKQLVRIGANTTIGNDAEALLRKALLSSGHTPTDYLRPRADDCCMRG